MGFMSATVTEFGYPCQPQTVSSVRYGPAVNSERKNPLASVAANVAKCMESGRGPASQIALGAKVGIGQSTVGRILTGENDPRIGTLDKIAAAYGLETWQLLVPDLDPKNPPILRSVSPAEEQLYKRLRDAAEELAAIKKS